MADPLDNPIWYSLTGPHAVFAHGNTSALRYAPDVAWFVGVPDPHGAGVGAIGEILDPGEFAIVFSVCTVVAPPGGQQVYVGKYHQMVCDHTTPTRPAIGHFEPVDPVELVEPAELGEADIDDMLALVALSEPGPFLARTHTLGHYIGIRHGDALVAMAGERMRIEGATEISAVCTHPDARGHGYAEGLVRRLTWRINARGERAFLHVSDENAPARRIYERIGFTRRVTMSIQVFRMGSTP